MEENTPWTTELVSERLQNLFEEEAIPNRQREYRDAAAVLNYFDMGGINPAGGEKGSEKEALAMLASDSEITADEEGLPHWFLRTELRRVTLRALIADRRIEDALRANPQRATSLGQQQFEKYLAGTAKPLQSQNLEELRATERACRLLEGLKEDLPAAPLLRQRIELALLLEPFRELVGDHFAGRDKELNSLADYVGVFGPSTVVERGKRTFEYIFSIQERPTLFINGPGGIGKSSLIAKFVLNHIDRPSGERFPFAYLDFDRPGLLAEEPITLLFEAMRQLGIQYPDSKSRLDDVRKEWNARVARQAKKSDRPTLGGWKDLRLADRDYYLESFGSCVESLQVGQQPLLLVLDTFEEIQLQSQALVDEVFAFLDALQKHVPRLRTVLSGRVASESPLYPINPLTLSVFDTTSASAFIAQKASVSMDVAKAVAIQVGGSPLTLKLAIDVLMLEKPAADGGIQGLRTGLWSRLLGETVQSQLYTRILNHIKNDEEVKRLAHPGLILRRITWQIIKDVLAEPCNVKVPDEATAKKLLDRLKKQVVLVSDTGNGVLVHRPDLRTVMLKPLQIAESQKVEQIHRKAVDYYKDFEDVVSRAEEIYHRLSLGIDRAQLSGRGIEKPEWASELRKRLGGSIHELAPASQAYLAARLEIEVERSVWDAAQQEDWEMHVIRLSRAQLQYDKPEEALRLLGERPKTSWTIGSELDSIEIDALIRMGHEAEARLSLAVALHRNAGNLNSFGGRRLMEQKRVLDATATRASKQASPQASSPSAQMRRAIMDALLDAFPSRTGLAMAVQFGMNVALDEIVAPTVSLSETVFQLVQWCLQSGRLEELIIACRQENPGNPKLFKVAQDLGLVTNKEVELQFEQLLRKEGQRVDLDLFRTSLTDLENRVCQIQLPGESAMEGFLVGPNVILTAYKLTAGAKFPPADAVIQFVRRQPCKLAEDWLIDYGPSRESNESTPRYLLARLDGLPGNDFVSAGKTRGWIKLRSNTAPPEKGNSLLILGYEGGTPQLTIDDRGIADVSADGQYFRHSSNTQTGSSGAPIFNSSFELIGIFAHAPTGKGDGLGVSITTAAILNALRQRGKLAVVDQSDEGSNQPGTVYNS